MPKLIDQNQYVLIPFQEYATLEEKLNALLNGEVILIRAFESTTKVDVVARLEQKKFKVTQISYDLVETELDKRYWVIFNIGLNDLSLFTVFRYEEESFSHANRYMVNDVVTYTSHDGKQDSAIIEEVYISKSYPEQYAYRLSRDSNVIYAEEDLIKHKYI